MLTFFKLPITKSSSFVSILLLICSVLISSCSSSGLDVENSLSSTQTPNTSEIDSTSNSSMSSNKTTSKADIKVALHKAMIKHIDSLLGSDGITYFDINNGELKSLFVSSHHPEIFIHEAMNNYVLCVSADDIDGTTYPVDVYIKNGPMKDNFIVYDVRIGENDRQSLMSLMDSKKFSRL